MNSIAVADSLGKLKCLADLIMSMASSFDIFLARTSAQLLLSESNKY